MRKLGQLTGWRFIAAFGVVLCHFSDQLFGNFPAIFVRCIHGMANFVAFFFILSGFILAYNYQEKFLSGRTSIREFLGARFARIYPAAIFSLLVALPAFLYFNVRGHPPLALLGSYSVASLVLVKTWFPFADWSSIPIWNGPMWSIETEAFFCLCFPFLIKPISKLTSGQNYWLFGGLAVTMIGLSTGYDLWLTNGSGERFHGAFELFHSSPYFCVLEFCFGIVTFNIARRLSVLQIELFQRHFRWAFIAIIVAYCVINATQTTMSLYHGWAAVLFSVVILGSYTQTRTLRLLETPTLVYLGEISFSLYLLHIPVRGLFEFGSKVVGPLAHLREAAPVIYAGSIILSSGMMAAFCYRFVEEPWRKRLRSLFSPPPRKVLHVESTQEAA